MYSSIDDNESGKKDFQNAVQDAVLGSAEADWKAYKTWCKEQGRSPNDLKNLNYYVEKVLVRSK